MVGLFQINSVCCRMASTGIAKWQLQSCMLVKHYWCICSVSYCEDDKCCHQTLILFSVSHSHYWKCKRVENCLAIISTISCTAAKWPRGLRPLACWDRGFESEWMDVFRLWVLCVVKYRYLWGAEHSSRGVLPSVLSSLVWLSSLDKTLAY
jgi:hypothetical protein